MNALAHIRASLLHPQSCLAACGFRILSVVLSFLLALSPLSVNLAYASSPPEDSGLGVLDAMDDLSDDGDLVIDRLSNSAWLTEDGEQCATASDGQQVYATFYALPAAVPAGAEALCAILAVLGVDLALDGSNPGAGMAALWDSFLAFKMNLDKAKLAYFAKQVSASAAALTDFSDAAIEGAVSLLTHWGETGVIPLDALAVVTSTGALGILPCLLSYYAYGLTSAMPHRVELSSLPFSVTAANQADFDSWFVQASNNYFEFFAPTLGDILNGDTSSYSYFDVTMDLQSLGFFDGYGVLNQSVSSLCPAATSLRNYRASACAYVFDPESGYEYRYYVVSLDAESSMNGISILSYGGTYYSVQGYVRTTYKVLDNGFWDCKLLCLSDDPIMCPDGYTIIYDGCFEYAYGSDGSAYEGSVMVIPGCYFQEGFWQDYTPWTFSPFSNTILDGYTRYDKPILGDTHGLYGVGNLIIGNDYTFTDNPDVNLGRDWYSDALDILGLDPYSPSTIIGADAVLEGGQVLNPGSMVIPPVWSDISSWNDALNQTHTGVVDGAVSIPDAGVNVNVGTAQGVQTGTITDVMAPSTGSSLSVPLPAYLGTALGGIGDVMKGKFPWCIPWDIYALMSVFTSTARAPAFTLAMDVPYIGRQSIYVDLSPYAPVAAVCRSLILVVFCIALAALSHRIITGGGE